MITTIDNPFNPHVDFRNWWLWDIHHGYNTLAVLARGIDPQYESKHGIKAYNELIRQRERDLVVNDLSFKYSFISPDETAPLDWEAYQYMEKLSNQDKTLEENETKDSEENVSEDTE